MKLLILSLTILASYQAAAATDQACFAQCTSNGSNFQFCQQRCEYQPVYQGSNFSGGQCLQQCRASGSNANFCQFKCAQ